MMLKITKTDESERDVHLSLEGTVTHQWAVLLDDVCRGYLQREKAVELDCAHVDFVDAKGISVLNNFPHHRVVLTGTPKFVKQLLNHGG